MNVSKIKPEEVTLLTRILFLPSEVIVYDPNSVLKGVLDNVAKNITDLLKRATLYKVCVNLSNEKLEIHPFDYLLEFGKIDHEYKSLYRESFSAVSNPDGSIRWFQCERIKEPLFLSLYSGSSFKATIYRKIVKLAFSFGAKSLICNNRFSLYSREVDYYRNKFESDAVAVFTGTVGENRKAVAAIYQGGVATHFVKTPVSEKAKDLIRKEHDHLQINNKYDFKTLLLPMSSMSDIGLKLTNICPEFSSTSSVLSTLHLMALKELYANTFKVKVLSTVEESRKIENRILNIKSVIEAYKGVIEIQKVERLFYNINVLFNSFDKEELIPIAQAHGDFTPWNMFVSKERIHLFDWELAMEEQTILYDAFHFVFQSGVLIRHSSFEQIKKEVLGLEKHEQIRDLIDRYNIDFWGCYRWYLIANCSYYLDLYLRQDNLHKQAFWLIDCWVSASNDAIKTIKRKTPNFS